MTRSAIRTVVGAGLSAVILLATPLRADPASIIVRHVNLHPATPGEAMHAFRQDGLSGGVFTSVWEPLRLNRMWLRCPLGHPNDATRADGKCEVCGKPLPAPEPYL